jgi:hypothetical protein
LGLRELLNNKNRALQLRKQGQLRGRRSHQNKRSPDQVPRLAQITDPMRKLLAVAAAVATIEGLE